MRPRSASCETSGNKSAGGHWPHSARSFAEQDTVVVERQAGYPHGHPAHEDADRRLRVEIEDGGLVLVLDVVGRPVPETPVHAHPLH
nr:DUF6296 family protein [Streptomyces sp. TLI_235]